jgi:hypothetical protein
MNEIAHQAAWLFSAPLIALAIYAVAVAVKAVFFPQHNTFDLLKSPMLEGVGYGAALAFVAGVCSHTAGPSWGVVVGGASSGVIGWLLANVAMTVKYMQGPQLRKRLRSTVHCHFTGLSRTGLHNGAYPAASQL